MGFLKIIFNMSVTGPLKIILNMSVTGSIMFLIFLLIKPLTKKNFGSSWHYYVLIMILMFFALPIGKFINISGFTPVVEIRQLINQNHAVENLDTKNMREDIHTNDFRDTEKPTNEQTPETKTKPDPVQLENPGIDSTDRKTGGRIDRKTFNIEIFSDMVPYIWIIGMIILLLLKIIPYIKFKTAILANSKEIEDKDVLGLFNLCKKNLNIGGRVSLKVCQDVGSPMLVGIFNPIILIKDIDKDDKALEMILLHELNHYKRKDTVVKVISVVVNAIHWFNPIVYILLNEIDKYCEYSIDEKVVGKMEIEDRKYYGETILRLIDSSTAKKNVFTTAMGSNAKKLKFRLKNMLFFKQTSKAKHVLSLIVLLSIFITGLAVGCDVVPTEIANINNSYTVYIKDDGLYFTYLDHGKESKIHDGDSFEYPLISKLGNYIAYTKNNSLYIYDIEAGEYEKVADEINHYHCAYDWVDDINIVYSTKNSGFTLFNVLTKESREHSDGDYYDSFKASNNNIIYGRKTSRWTTEEGEFSATDGIAEINLNEYNSENKTFASNIIIEGRKSTDEGTGFNPAVWDKIGVGGYNPVVWNITEDGKYIYIMEKSASGSFSSDVIGIGIYDVDKKVHTVFANPDTLSYKNHLAINPKYNDIIGLIEGADREMIKNKKAVLLDINEDKTYNTINFMEEDLVAMTPSFTLDGEKLLYSATKDLKNSPITFSSSYYAQWKNQPHNIYEYNIKTSTVRKITEGDNFDFMPVNISKDEILFIRYKGDGHYSLIKLVNGKENIVADNVVFSGGEDNYPFEFYGHIQTEKAMDIFYGKAKLDSWGGNFKDDTEIDEFWDTLITPQNYTGLDIYWRYIDDDTMEKADHLIEKYGVDALFAGLESTNVYSRYYCINRLVEYYNDDDIRIRAISEITPFLNSTNNTLKHGAEFAIDVLSKKFDSPYVVKAADGTKIFALFNGYSDYGSYNELWIIRDDKLSKLYSFGDDLHTYIAFTDDSIKLSPDNDKIAVQTATRRSSSFKIIDLNTKEASPEIMKLAIEKVAMDNKDYNNTYPDGQYCWGGNIKWLDNNTVEFEAGLAYDYMEIIEDVIVKYDILNNSVEYVKLRTRR